MRWTLSNISTGLGAAMPRAATTHGLTGLGSEGNGSQRKPEALLKLRKSISPHTSHSARATVLMSAQSVGKCT